ncbi:PRP1 splicing factor, N-terminal-domain-containing protein [Fimicolochytrium jonesii]|uniref:PRP1 splicing factor, N-terminal-domain-containing protein n=1 Tax=Fimicolochytrium jonesii TaxID=1396493 RepID=UPI0022FE6023|nr:PRP1 splicing factor, N-terminal-domain-containing protein [Fimicolochytrium jonesii]KAI8824841.1 PRP1 splicing factor, N-terminal-domain-containing protein [Fimicolochytrium jonesii]
MYQFKQLVVPDFLNKKAPPNYIAGLGRGATGFTTRSDIGPAREGPTEAALEKAKAAAEGKGPSNGGDDDDDERFQDPDNETGLFNAAPYEADDEEADRIYEEVDAKMDERRRARREAREREELEKYRKERPKIQQQFADLKRGLAAVSEDEWASIPDVGDLVRKGKRQKKFADKYVPVPDSVLLGASSQSALTNTLDAKQQLLGGFATPAGAMDGTMTDFSQFGQARDKVLGLKLDQISDSVAGQSIVDPKGYLTDLSSIVVQSDAEISDIKKARSLLRSVTATNPKHAPGWIAAARLEEVAGKQGAAREIIAKGCEECPTSEDVWLESARLNTTDNAKVILAQAIRHVPQSVKIWSKACDLESDPKGKKRVLRRALEFIPNSVKLWKAAVSMEEDPDDARILLSRAVECIPLAIELWLALARLESYENAVKVINKARAKNPTSHEIWLAGAKLVETNGNTKMVDVMLSRAVKALAEKGSTLNRDNWIQEAETAEKEGYVATCQAIIAETIGMGVEDEDRKSTWMEDAESCIAHGSYITARAIYAHALKVFPHKKSIWRRAAFLEKSHGTRDSLEEILQRAVRYCPQAEVLWLMGAKEKWLAGDIPAAKGILEAAFAANPNSEQIWLAAIKLEVETGEYARARILLASAREKANTERVWMKSAVLERQLGQPDAALTLLATGIAKFPTAPKLYMIKGQIESAEKNDPVTARETYTKAIRAIPSSTPLWLLLSRLEESTHQQTKARATLEKARIMNPKNPQLWCEAVRVETRAGNTPMARALLAKALQECPTSGMLWAEAILMEPRAQRKTRSADALKKCENDPVVVVTVARLFWAERKVDKARNWFGRAVKTDPDLGDSWAWWYKFEGEHGEQQHGGANGAGSNGTGAAPNGANGATTGENERQKDVVKACIAAEPAHGEKWQAVAKDLANVGKSSDEILRIVARGLVNTI